MNEENLYIDIKSKICDKIFDGTFAEGEKIPSERQLAESMQVSRITLRRALEILEREELITREVGSGTRVTLPNRCVPGNMDMVVLIAPARNPFFSDFIRKFQEAGQQRESMILYVEKPRNEDLTESLYRIYKKGLRNAVIWLEDLVIDREKLKRLRALGMNMVFFDTDAGMPYADCVTLDNEQAMLQLCTELSVGGKKEVGYIGWDNEQIYSKRVREAAFLNTFSGNVLLQLPWRRWKDAGEIVLDYLKKNREQLPEVILCADRQCGTAVAEALSQAEIDDVILAGIDDFPEAEHRKSVVCAQDIDAAAQKIFECLEIQNTKAEDWKPEILRIPGMLKKYEFAGVSRRQTGSKKEETV